MREQIDVIYENGVLRPLGPLPEHFHEHQQLTVTIQGENGKVPWPSPDTVASLEDVRRILAKTSHTLAHEVAVGREER
jgi:predicted DNA-binding antitoxin AbrB/MazE fold protein